MLKLLRYTLAAIFLAASVGCLALSGWSYSLDRPAVLAHFSLSKTELSLTAFAGTAAVVERRSPQFSAAFVDALVRDSARGLFGRFNQSSYFPLWYPALVFALAAVGVLRLGQPFTIRSALIVTTVVAALLGMVVAL